MKKILKLIICLLILWSAMFVTDFCCCASLREPVFVIANSDRLADNGGSGTYYGLGYTVEIEKKVDAEVGLTLVSVEMRMFGKVIAASIT